MSDPTRHERVSPSGEAPTKLPPLEELAERLLGKNGHIFTWTGNCMTWCEQEIKASASPRANEVFGLAVPTPVLVYCTEAIYRAHVRELIERLDDPDSDTTKPTAAEICRLYSELSLKAPLVASHAAVYSVAFARAFPDAANDIGPAHYMPLDHPFVLDAMEMIERYLSRPERRRGR